MIELSYTNIGLGFGLGVAFMVGISYLALNFAKRKAEKQYKETLETMNILSKPEETEDTEDD